MRKLRFTTSLRCEQSSTDDIDNLKDYIATSEVIINASVNMHNAIIGYSQDKHKIMEDGIKKFRLLAFMVAILMIMGVIIA